MAAIKGDVIDIAQPRTPALIAEEVRREHAAVGNHLHAALDRAIRCGDLLAEAKAGLDHGEWGPWLKTAGLAPRTASLYMQLAANRQRIADLPSINEAVRAISRPRTWEQLAVQQAMRTAPRLRDEARGYVAALDAVLDVLDDVERGDLDLAEYRLKVSALRDGLIDRETAPN
jgi:hypothetical protein